METTTGETERGSGTAARVIRNLRSHWRALALAAIVFKVLALVVLTPIVSVAFRSFLAFSGRTVLADTDILHFLASPIGWLCFVFVGALWLAIMALEQAALLHILRGRKGELGGSVVGAIRFALLLSPRVLAVTARIAGYALATSAPFLIVAGLIYVALLGRYDINFYLAEKPPAFWWAVGCGAVLLASLAAVLLRLASGWFFALPLLVFEGSRGKEAVRISRELAVGRRTRLIGWLAGWLAAGGLISLLGTLIIRQAGQLLAPQASASLTLLLFTVGVIAVTWTVFNLVVNILSTISFGLILEALYCELGRSAPTTAFAGRQRSSWVHAVTKTRMLLGGVLAVAVALGVGGVVFATIRLDLETEVTAHRGGAATAPENTLAAFRAAIDDGADWVEIDVQETADGHVVVFHDSDFKRLAGNPLKIWDATLEDLQSIDIGSSFSAAFQGERVPTLAEVLDLCRGRVGVNIELKYYGHDQRLEQRVIDLVEQRDMQSEIVVMSLKSDAVKKMRELRPSWRVGLLTAVAVGGLRQVDADFLAVSAGIASNRLIDAAHANGKEVHVWTTNDRLTMSMMIGRGADNLITDQTAMACEVIQSRNELSAGERLLLGSAELLGIPPKFTGQ